MLNLGFNEIDKIQLGSNEIESVYLGTTEIFGSKVKEIYGVPSAGVGVPSAMYSYNNKIYVAYRIAVSTSQSYINLYEYTVSSTGSFESRKAIFSHAALTNGSLTDNASSPGTDYITVLKHSPYSNRLFCVGVETSIIVYDLDTSSIIASSYFQSKAAQIGALVDDDGTIVMGYTYYDEGAQASQFRLGAYWYGTNAKNVISVSQLYGAIVYKDYVGSASRYYAFRSNAYDYITVQVGSSVSISIGSSVSIASTLDPSDGVSYDSNTNSCYGVSTSARYIMSKINLSTNQVTNINSFTGYAFAPTQNVASNSFICYGQKDKVHKIDKASFEVLETIDVSKVCSSIVLTQPFMFNARKAILVIGQNAKVSNEYSIAYVKVN